MTTNKHTNQTQHTHFLQLQMVFLLRGKRVMMRDVRRTGDEYGVSPHKVILNRALSKSTNFTLKPALGFCTLIKRWLGDHWLVRCRGLCYEELGDHWLVRYREFRLPRFN